MQNAATFFKKAFLKAKAFVGLFVKLFPLPHDSHQNHIHTIQAPLPCPSSYPIPLMITILSAPLSTPTIYYMVYPLSLITLASVSSLTSFSHLHHILNLFLRLGFLTHLYSPSYYLHITPTLYPSHFSIFTHNFCPFP